MAYFPLFIELTGRRVLVVGGGEVALRRVRALLPFGCEILVVSPVCAEGILSLYREGKLGLRLKEYGRDDLPADGGEAETAADWSGPETAKETGPAGPEALKEVCARPVFVLAAATPEVNEAVVRDCREAGIPVNNASDRRQCDFYFPGLAKDGELVVGITSGGADHKKAARVGAAVRKLVEAEGKAGAAEIM